MRLVLTVPLVLLSVACAPEVGVGSPCTRASDCPAPYTCIASRCRAECVTHRDCPPATRCAAGSDGILVCTLLGETCDGASPCEDGLECRSGQCFDACSGMSCPAGGTCNAGICDRPPDDAGAPADVPAAGRAACRSDAECGPMGVCASAQGSEPVCRRRCTTHAECGTSDTSAGCGFFRSALGPDVAACSIPCDLFGGAASGCPTGEACDVFELSTPVGPNAVVIDCRAVDPGMVGQDGPCDIGPGGWDPTLCASELTCDGAGPLFTCQQICTVSGAFGRDCPSGTACEAFGVDARWMRARLGSCDPL